ncbi:hypothetical protein C8R46DRAFT_1050549 [Mycena filopes]|nr:hypothetical protein C8R46DRAFT_1050549 [Mycena filopes]
MASSSPSRAPGSSPGYRAPNRSQRVDASIDYEMKRGDTTHDKSFYMSRDGRRGVHREVNVTRKRRLRPDELTDSLRDWIPLEEGGEELEAEDAGNAETGDKRKRYVSSVETMTPWRGLVQKFLDEMVRLFGVCRLAASLYAAASHAEVIPVANELCQEWNGNYWVKTSFQELKCVFQLGHGGHPCPRPPPATRKMVVIDVGGVFTLDYKWCGCDGADEANNLEQLLRNGWYPATTVDPQTCATFAALELFRLLNVVGNVNVHDFVGTLERRTDAMKVKVVPDRYKAFGLMSRQWAFLKRLLHAGRAHDMRMAKGTKCGECAVLCWACPHDKINIPDGWRDVAPEFQFLYMLFLAIDANFRLKNRLRANEHQDLPLGSGLGYMVEDSAYKKHLVNYVAEKDVSTCIAFAALLQKETRLTTGLRCSGVGGVGLGDLQKGERYANMDYILLSSVLGITLLYLAISYDIACQWRINLESRMALMPESMRLNLEEMTVLSGLPVWHAAAHERSCQAENSLSYMVGAARTDGEGIERTWSVLNPLAWATKEMGAGNRQDTMEDNIDHHNFEKNINQGTTLPKKLLLATDERDRQVAAFVEVDRTLKSELRDAWQKQIDDWVADRSKPNPYVLDSDDGQSEAAIKLALTQEEAREAAAGGVKLQGSSVTSFIIGGLQLEASQRRIRREVKGRTLLVADHSQKVAEMRLAFFKKLGAFRRLQRIYMPGAVKAVEAEEDKCDPELPPPKAEDVQVFLPSSLESATREAGCREGLPEKEGLLREGQCRDSLHALRSTLHTKKHLVDWRDSAVVGQRAATRANTLFERVGERVDAEATKYRQARQALISLRGVALCTEWKELRAADIQLDEEREVDAAARRKLGNIGSKRFRRQGPALSSKEKRMSWIWTAGGGPGEDEAQLHDCRWNAGDRTEVQGIWDRSVQTAVRLALQDDTLLMESMGAFVAAMGEGEEEGATG